MENLVSGVAVLIVLSALTRSRILVRLAVIGVVVVLLSPCLSLTPRSFPGVEVPAPSTGGVLAGLVGAVMFLRFLGARTSHHRGTSREIPSTSEKRRVGE